MRTLVYCSNGGTLITGKAFFQAGKRRASSNSRPSFNFSAKVDTGQDVVMQRLMHSQMSVE